MKIHQKTLSLRRRLRMIRTTCRAPRLRVLRRKTGARKCPHRHLYPPLMKGTWRIKMIISMMLIGPTRSIILVVGHRAKILPRSINMRGANHPMPTKIVKDERHCKKVVPKMTRICQHRQLLCKPCRRTIRHYGTTLRHLDQGLSPSLHRLREINPIVGIGPRVVNRHFKMKRGVEWKNEWERKKLIPSLIVPEQDAVCQNQDAACPMVDVPTLPWI
mmetsp:Transcript_22662/g.40929  ORF Transcript_22662/g.40929 Transcript_22662/m.40929 type:complete len:217 (+) Transcript_22662:2717-3367(+)